MIIIRELKSWEEVRQQMRLYPDYRFSYTKKNGEYTLRGVER